MYKHMDEDLSITELINEEDLSDIDDLIIEDEEEVEEEIKEMIEKSKKAKGKGKGKPKAKGKGKGKKSNIETLINKKEAASKKKKKKVKPTMYKIGSREVLLEEWVIPENRTYVAEVLISSIKSFINKNILFTNIVNHQSIPLITKINLALDYPDIVKYLLEMFPNGNFQKVLPLFIDMLRNEDKIGTKLLADRLTTFL